MNVLLSVFCLFCQGFLTNSEKHAVYYCFSLLSQVVDRIDMKCLESWQAVEKLDACVIGQEQFNALRKEK